MTLSKKQVDETEDVLRVCLRHKFENYKPEPHHMPFHTRLLGKDRLALFSFIQSLNTKFKRVERQAVAGDRISANAHIEIQSIIDGLTTAESKPDKNVEIERIRRVCQLGEMTRVKPTKVDLLAESENGDLFLIDIKTAKPNSGGFKEFKRTLLEWVATVLAQNPYAHITTAIAIPYNPYAPQKYARWTIRGMLDIDRELFVAEEFWDFLGGQGAFDELLNIFERVGIKLGPEIERAFERFK